MAKMACDLEDVAFSCNESVMQASRGHGNFTFVALVDRLMFA